METDQPPLRLPPSVVNNIRDQVDLESDEETLIGGSGEVSVGRRQSKAALVRLPRPSTTRERGPGARYAASPQRGYGSVSSRSGKIPPAGAALGTSGLARTRRSSAADELQSAATAVVQSLSNAFQFLKDDAASASPRSGRPYAESTPVREQRTTENGTGNENDASLLIYDENDGPTPSRMPHEPDGARSDLSDADLSDAEINPRELDEVGSPDHVPGLRGGRGGNAINPAAAAAENNPRPAWRVEAESQF